MAMRRTFGSASSRVPDEQYKICLSYLRSMKTKLYEEKQRAKVTEETLRQMKMNAACNFDPKAPLSTHAWIASFATSLSTHMVAVSVVQVRKRSKEIQENLLSFISSFEIEEDGSNPFI